MANSFALLWQKILRSSLWIKGSKETRLVWITMLALRDSDGFVATSLIGLADSAKVDLDECKAAILELESPDPDDTSGVDEGRRIKKVQGGWQIVNHELYRFSTEAKREFWRNQKAQERKSKSEHQPEPSPSSAATKFQKPTIEQLMAEGLSEKEARKCFHFYESNGWKVGKNPMKNWKGAAAGWLARSEQYSNNGGGQQPSQISPKRQEEILKGMGSKSYSQMTPEERAVMDEVSS